MTTEIEKKIVNLELTVDELNMVIGALQELPYRVVNATLNKVIQQAQAQLQGS